MTRPTVSVIMNCYNSAKYLREAIDSVYCQTYPHWEIIFWDNASTDDSAAIAKSHDGRLRYFRGETTLPLGAARNLALERATGGLVAFLDCDDLWLPEKLATQVGLFENRPEVDFAYANFYHLDQLAGSKKPAFDKPQPEGFVFGSFLNRYRVGILTAIVRRSALDRLDVLFDETFNLVEEFDVFMRVLYGAQAAYIATPLAVCRIHEANTSTIQRDGWVAELRRVLEKFKRLDRDGRFSGELENMAVRIDLTAASIDISQGRPNAARKHVAPHKWHSLKSFALFIISFVPAPLWTLLRPLWRRGLLYR
jgi:glycosyltransferase involved in cell wall biosynthesis